MWTHLKQEHSPFYIWSYKMACYCLRWKYKTALCISLISDEHVFNLRAAELGGTAALMIPHVQHDQCKRFPPHITEMHHKPREKYQEKFIFKHNSILGFITRILLLFFGMLKLGTKIFTTSRVVEFGEASGRVWN